MMTPIDQSMTKDLGFACICIKDFSKLVFFEPSNRKAFIVYEYASMTEYYVYLFIYIYVYMCIYIYMFI